VKLPKGDVLIHCGDLTNQGSLSELTKQVQWLEKADFECKIVVAGNHDLTLDTDFYSKYGSYRCKNNNAAQVPVDCQALLTEAKTLTYMLHESRNFKLASPSGPRTAFSVFGSPYSAAWGGAWAFQYPRDDGGIAAKALWDQIPLDTDILITHGPAHTHCDEARMREPAGCEVLRQALWRVRPRLALCGHIHEARGVERVRWNLESRDARFAEKGRTGWEDLSPESEKIALVDLTAKKGGAPLDNDGSLYLLDDKSYGKSSAQEVEVEKQEEGYEKGKEAAPLDISNFGIRRKLDLTPGALAGRLGRRETCIVNCAIQAGIYPHSGRGGRKLNKAIVVDLDLPMWEDEDPHE
jgi:hypothetical protein